MLDHSNAFCIAHILYLWTQIVWNVAFQFKSCTSVIYNLSLKRSRSSLVQSPCFRWVEPSQAELIPPKPSWSHPATSSSTVDKYVTWRDLDRMRTKVSSSCIGLISLLVLGLICTHLHSCCTTDAIYSEINQQSILDFSNQSFGSKPFYQRVPSNGTNMSLTIKWFRYKCTCKVYTK